MTIITANLLLWVHHCLLSIIGWHKTIASQKSSKYFKDSEYRDTFKESWDQ